MSENNTIALGLAVEEVQLYFEILRSYNLLDVGSESDTRAEVSAVLRQLHLLRAATNHLNPAMPHLAGHEALNEEVIKTAFPKAEESEADSELVDGLQELQFSLQRLLNTMDNNQSLLDDSVREVRTARQIAAESNRSARCRMLREGNPELKVAAK